jgi:hypothetical protein
MYTYSKNEQPSEHENNKDFANFSHSVLLHITLLSAISDIRDCLSVIWFYLIYDGLYIT